VETTFEAFVLGLVQGLTEFLPISSSGHLILVPALLGWHDPFIDSLAFSVMLHMGTLVALLVYFWQDWRRLVPAAMAAVRDRSIGNDQDRRLALLLAVTVIPAAVAGALLNDVIERDVRAPGLVAVMFVLGAAVLWLAERWGTRTGQIGQLGVGAAFGIGVAQSLALVPGVSRSGISIAGGMFAGLTRDAAARFSFLMAAPVIAGAGLFEFRKLISGDAGVALQPVPLVVGVVTSFVAGMGAIWFLLRYLRTNTMYVFVAYRLVLAGIVVLWVLGLPWK
jgi:undecaprenyl-diphosphatase